LLAGSRARRSGAADSDHDVVLLFPSLPNGAWREMVLFEGHHIEAFAQDLGTLAYFCREVDRPSGRPVLPVMIAEGISAFSRNSTLLEAARKIASETQGYSARGRHRALLRARRFCAQGEWALERHRQGCSARTGDGRTWPCGAVRDGVSRPVYERPGRACAGAGGCRAAAAGRQATGRLSPNGSGCMDRYARDHARSGVLLTSPRKRPR
jgi:hypothetical protein